jgi:predicted DCC family thiol-disulfide oxidoreductase YuxK
MNKIEVFHDGECPVCRLEIAFYRRVDREGRILWTDIVQLSDHELPAGKSRADLLGRFHVRELAVAQGADPAVPPAKPSSDWHVGVDAFARIWRALPGFKWFAWIFSVPGIRQLSQLAYLGFIRWQARRRVKRFKN